MQHLLEKGLRSFQPALRLSSTKGTLLQLQLEGGAEPVSPYLFMFPLYVRKTWKCG